VKNIKEIN